MALDSLRGACSLRRSGVHFAGICAGTTPFPCRSFSRVGHRALALLFAIGVLFPLAPAAAQNLDLTLTASGSAATGRPLPLGAMPRLTITIRNAGKGALGPVSLVARHDGLAAANTQGWRIEDGASVSEIPRLAAGERAERILRLRVDRAPFEATKNRIRMEVRSKDSAIAQADFEMNVADCVGAYRAKLEALRPNLSLDVRDAAEAMRRADPALPAGRAFPATGARRGELAEAERLAAAFAARRGADAEMATEWFRFLIQRWSSELNNYAGQSANPGMCANNYYQIAGYRQGLLPITKRIDTVRIAAANSLTAVREAMRGETGESVSELVQRLVIELEPNFDEDVKGSLATLAAMRAKLNGERRPEPDAIRKLSLMETAAWLSEADRRGQALAQAIERVLSMIATAHKESCVCAF